MKTHILGRKSAGQGARLVLAFAVLLLAGCVVTSIYPFYTEKDLFFNPALLGKWCDASATNQPPEYAQVEAAGEKGYRLTVFTKEQTNGSELHLFRLGQQLFMDEFPTNRSLDFVPTHQLSKVMRVEPTLQAASMNYDWLAGLLEKHPRAIRHLVLPDQPGDKNGRIVLTADTRELQRFVLKYLNDTNAWNKPSEWKRLE